MNALIAFSTLLAASQAQLLAAPYAASFAPYYNGFNGYAAGYRGLPLAAHGYAAPAPLAAPVAAVAPAIPAPLTAPSSQFHAQDEFANFNFGYSNINSAKQETGNAYGGRVGSWSYIDANGIPQRVDYIADAAGFRVKATNLPVAPIHNLESPVYTGVAPAPVQDTAEVAAAKAEHFAAIEEAKNREKRDAQVYAAAPYAAPFAYNYGTPYAFNNFGYSGLYNNAYNGLYNNAYNGLYNNGFLGYNALPYAAATYAAAAPVAAAPVAAAPLAAATYAAPAAVAAAPAAREAVLTTVKLNPGHAVAYRVD